ncbi:recombinase family protein [Microvirga pudoricolor]|uniref:recombinase family protein n=1 Tax=Microvirga pudoricolor TaxID=2778729 RepID=UPI0019512C09|nr:recombinase family protein [Microvirga pudoricolor]MBM6595581.1 recombinase family protein [Microvirga pudoricolor]
MALAYSYIRYSTKGQVRGDSHRRQVELSDTFAQKNRLRIVKNYSDLGVSAFRSKNKTEGQLKAFMDDVTAQKIRPGSWLLVESLDRLSREKVGTALPWFINLLNAGIKIGTIMDDRIYDQDTVNDPMQLMGSLMIMSRANEESEKKSERVKHSWVGRRKNGIKGAICPSWLFLDTDGQYKPYPERVKVIHEIFELTISGVGTYTIARMLNDRREPPFKTVVGRKGAGWHPTTVYNLLSNRALLGFHQPGAVEDGQKVKVGEEVADYYPKVIDEDLWLRAQAARKKHASGAKGLYLTNLLGNRAECLACKSPMKIVTKAVAKGRPDHGKVFRYFACSNAEAKRGCPGGERFNYDEVEAAILDHIPEYRLSDVFENTRDMAELKECEKQIGAVAFKLGELEKRRDRMAREISLTDDDDPLLDLHRKTLREIVTDIRKGKESLDGLAEAKAELEAQQDDRSDLEAVIAQFRAELETATGDDLYRYRAKLSSALQTFIDYVWFDFENEVFDVVLMGGAIVHRFKKTNPQGRGRARRIQYVGSVNVLKDMGDTVVREAFTTMTRDPGDSSEDPLRVEVFNKLKP